MLLEHPPSNTCIVYSEYGFGPTNPWGLLFIGGECTSMGADYQWYSRLEDVFRESQAWDGANPDGYEMP